MLYKHCVYKHTVPPRLAAPLFRPILQVDAGVLTVFGPTSEPITTCVKGSICEVEVVGLGMNLDHFV